MVNRVGLTILLTALLGLATCGLLLPLFLELWSLLKVVFGRRHGVPAAALPLPRLLFLVPAHNEERLVGACLRSILDQDYPADSLRVVVIADNCSDGTARITNEMGVVCFERSDPTLSGKPRALAWALPQLLDEPWEACVLVDADAVVASNYASLLAARSPLWAKVVQTYSGATNERDNWLTRLAGVLSRCRYQVSYVLKTRAGLNSPLMCCGTSIGRRLLDPGGWDAFSLTENWELYARFAAAGVKVELEPAAILLSEQAGSMRQGQTQRRRWLAGRIGVLRSYAGAIVRSDRIGLHQKLDALVELGGLSPVLHLAAALAVASAGLLMLPGGPKEWIVGGALLSLVSLTLQVLIVLFRHPEPGATLAAFAMLPVYAGWRVVVLFRTILGRRDTTWRRTARD